MEEVEQVVRPRLPASGGGLWSYWKDLDAILSDGPNWERLEARDLADTLLRTGLARNSYFWIFEDSPAEDPVLRYYTWTSDAEGSDAWAKQLAWACLVDHKLHPVDSVHPQARPLLKCASDGRLTRFLAKPPANGRWVEKVKSEFMTFTWTNRLYEVVDP